jgi:trk system potassium uptake protein TrkH
MVVVAFAAVVLIGTVLLALLVSGKLRLRLQLTAQAETKSLGIGDVRRVLLGVAGTTFAVEAAVGAALSLRSRCAFARATTPP